MQEAIVGGLSNVWHRSNIAGKIFISYLAYDYINKKVYSADTKNLVTHICGVDFNVLYPSAYSSIPNEMIGYTGNKMLMPGNFTEYQRQAKNVGHHQRKERVVCNNSKRMYS
jgi:hypothetical protein